MLQKIRTLIERLYLSLGNLKVFIGAIVLLVAQSLWLVFSAIYPLPFDEYYHIGIIQIYARQWSPFISQQSAEASLYGDITRYPSYLYHYLMSFPYRFFDVFIDSETILIILMRLINVAFVVGAIILFRKLFLKAGISKRIINVTVLFFVVTPIVPFLAAHVNYDNLMLLLTSVVLYFAYKVYVSKPIDVSSLAWFFSVGLINILVKNSFLPIFVALFLILTYRLLREYKTKLFSQFAGGYKKIGSYTKLAIVLAVLLSSVLFVERYGYNLAKYHTLWPKCNVVQSDKVCQNFMPWYRNSQNKLHPPLEVRYGNPISFSQHWVSKISRGYFAIFSHTPTNVLKWYEPFGPIVLRALLPIPITVAITVVSAGLIILITKLKYIWQNNFIRLSLALMTAQLITLWLFNYRTYLDLGVAQAIQARYMYPLLLVSMLVLAFSYNQLNITKNVKIILFLAVFSIYAWGGGVAGWVIRSDSLWYWQNPTVESINTSTQNVLKKVIWH
jgi:hypothetical protein